MTQETTPASDRLEEWERLANAAIDAHSRQKTVRSADFEDALAESTIAREHLTSVAFEAIPALIAMVRERDATINVSLFKAMNDFDAAITAAEARATAAEERVKELEADHEKLRAAFRVNALRWNPSTSHADIDAEIDRALGRET